jgi:hypothetical protein
VLLLLLLLPLGCCWGLGRIAMHVIWLRQLLPAGQAMHLLPFFAAAAAAGVCAAEPGRCKIWDSCWCAALPAAGAAEHGCTPLAEVNPAKAEQHQHQFIN